MKRIMKKGYITSGPTSSSSTREQKELIKLYLTFKKHTVPLTNTHTLVVYVTKHNRACVPTYYTHTEIMVYNQRINERERKKGIASCSAQNNKVKSSQLFLKTLLEKSCSYLSPNRLHFIFLFQREREERSRQGKKYSCKIST